MPAEALITLRDELSPLASDLAVRAILFRYGFRSGEACMQSMGINGMEPEELPDILTNLWDEIGLRRLSVRKDKKMGFALQLNESIEGNVIGEVGLASCDFTRGYLAGMVSCLSGKKIYRLYPGIWNLGAAVERGIWNNIPRLHRSHWCLDR